MNREWSKIMIIQRAYGWNMIWLFHFLNNTKSIERYCFRLFRDKLKFILQ